MFGLSAQNGIALKTYQICLLLKPPYIRNGRYYGTQFTYLDSFEEILVPGE